MKHVYLSNIYFKSFVPAYELEHGHEQVHRMSIRSEEQHINIALVEGRNHILIQDVHMPVEQQRFPEIDEIVNQ